MTPSDDTLELLGLELIASLALVAVIAGLVTFAILRAATRTTDVGVIVAVSILTLVGIVGFIATQNEALITLSGTGLGALAGAITQIYRSSDDDHAE